MHEGRVAGGYNTHPATNSKRMETTSFSVAHVSDPHLTHLERAQPRELCNKRILGFLSWRRRRRHHHRPEVLDALLADVHSRQPNHVVITGDLTHIGLPDEFRQARAWLEKLGTPDTVTVIPGNHDTYVSDEWARTFGQISEYLRSDAALNWSTEDYPSIRIREPWAIIGLSSAIPTAPFLATGRLGESQRLRLAQLLQELQTPELLRLVLIHHAPLPGVDKMRRRLVDGRETLSTLLAGRPHLILHGHGHRARWNSAGAGDTAVPIIAVPSASYTPEDAEKFARYNIYHATRVDSGWAVEAEVRGMVDGRFIELARRPVRIPQYAP